MTDIQQFQNILSQEYNRDFFVKNVLSPIFKNQFSYYSVSEKINISEKAEKKVIQEAKMYGEISVNSYEKIFCYEILLQPNVKLEHNRVAVQQFVRKMLRTGEAAFINFVSPTNNETWRFTFVSKNVFFTEKGIESKFSNAKRYTYLLGPAEKCKTAAERFVFLMNLENISLENITEAFSVEKLSKDFFTEYKNHYQKVVDFINKSNFKTSVFCDDDKNIRNFAKKLLGRIVFLYFVQKKGWLGATNLVDQDGNLLYQDGNKNFIFDFFQKTGKNENFYELWLKKLFFETLNQKRDNDNFVMPDNSIVKIPYLNGGLFDKEIFDDKILTLNATLFHNDNFFDAEIANKRGFFDFLNAFNFTIYEDSPNEQTVAIDPEMLGHIFENLLEDNKEKGAYYTPKEIVHYMCQESLIEYLNHKLENPDKKIIENLVKDKDFELLKITEVRTINDLLDKVKICDPAIGSGAFPMGLLQEIFNIKEVLNFLNEGEWKAAEIKEKIIINSIYGVDIEKGAVDIARLRFWLALVVDEKTPKPLPNLDYKIVEGNSLVPILDNEVINIEWDENITKDGVFAQKNREKNIELLQKISQKQREYFQTQRKDKQNLAKEIRNIKIDILCNQLNFMVKTKGNEAKPNETGKKVTEQTRLYLKTEGWKNTAKKLQELKTNDQPLDFFDWKIDFAEVLNEKINENTGFDIVIGNPPYVDYRSINNETKQGLVDYFSYKETKTASLFVYFIEKSINLLKNQGTLSFINPIQYFSSDSGIGIRKFIFQNSFLYKVVDVSNIKVFEAATYTCINFIKKTLENRNFTKLYKPENLSDFHYNFINLDLKQILSDKNFKIVMSTNKIIDKVENVTSFLKDFCHIFCGISMTGFRNFVIDKVTYDKLNKENKNKYAFLLESSNIHKYFFESRSFILMEIFSKNAKNFFEKENIFLGKMTKWIRATKSECGFYAGKVNVLTNFKININYILAILNSKLINYYYFIKNEAKHLAGGYLGFDIPSLSQIPIPEISAVEQKPFIDLVDEIIADKKNNLDTSGLEKQIDEMVYKLYQLTAEEIAVIEK